MKTIMFLILAAAMFGCSSEDVPQAHKGRMFDKTGFFAFYAGGTGFHGPILNPGTYFTAIYPEVRMVDCSRRTIKEPMTALAKDNVQFSLDVYISFGANCEDDAAVTKLLSNLAPIGAVAHDEKSAPGAGQGQIADKDPIETDPDRTITSRQIYDVFVRPAIGEAVRQSVAGYNANDVNGHREEVFQKILDKLSTDLGKDDPKLKLVSVYGLNLSNLDFPKEMEDANTDRATQGVLRDKALAEQDRVKVETETARLKIAQTQTEAQGEAAKIDTIGAALHRNPEYYVRDVYFYAAEKGGSVVLPANPNVILQMTPHMGH